MTGNVEESSRPEAPIAVGVGAAEGTDGRKAVQTALESALGSLGEPPALVVLSAGTGYDLREVIKCATALCDPSLLIGGSVAAPIFTESGVLAGERGRVVGALALSGPGVRAGVGAADLSRAPRRAGETAAQLALDQARHRERSPRAMLVFMPPGAEEQVLQGVVTVVGRGVPLWGCTVADEDLSGRWAVFHHGTADPGAVTVAVLYGEFLAGSAFGSGYWLSASSASASEVDGRMVGKLDGSAAADVYAAWLGADPGDLVGAELRRRAVSQPWGVEDARGQHLLVKEPGTLAGTGSVGLFADVREGETVRLLSSTAESLLAATSAAAAEALGRASLPAGLVRGVLLAHGAGRALSLRERVRSVPAQLLPVTGGAPVLGMSGYGEQSSLPDGRPAHLNLSVSILALGG